MLQSTRTQWWLLLIVAFALVVAWPPSDDKSLGMKFVNWAVDPTDSLPVLLDHPRLAWRRGASAMRTDPICILVRYNVST